MIVNSKEIQRDSWIFAWYLILSVALAYSNIAIAISSQFLHIDLEWKETYLYSCQNWKIIKQKYLWESYEYVLTLQIRTALLSSNVAFLTDAEIGTRLVGLVRRGSELMARVTKGTSNLLGTMICIAHGGLDLCKTISWRDSVIKSTGLVSLFRSSRNSPVPQEFQQGKWWRDHFACWNFCGIGEF